MGRKHKSVVAPGVYQRPGTKNYWLRYTAGGSEVRTSLGTADKSEAVKIADQIMSGAAKSTVVGWALAVEKYISKKLAEEIFTENTAKTVRYALSCFEKHCTPTPSSPSDITTKALQGFYEALRKKKYSEATSQAYLTKVASFATAHKIKVEKPRFRGEATGVKKVITLKEIDRLIDEAPKFELKAILHFGFCCGLRKDEIVNIRPSWIDLKTKRLTIPAKEGTWQTKSKRSRVIPLRQKTADFLEENRSLWQDEKYVIAPKANGVRYRYDFRRPFTEYMTEKGYKDATPHLMRHTFATLLAEQNVSPIMISSWTGDRIKTVEKHYLHTQAASSDMIDEAFGDKEPENTRQLKKLEQQIAQSISLIESLHERQGKKITKSEALTELAKNPTFAPVVEDFSTQAMLDKMTDEQREEFLNSLPF